MCVYVTSSAKTCHVCTITNLISLHQPTDALYGYPSPVYPMLNVNWSRHTVVCQWPRKQKKTQGTQVCYLLVP